MTSCHSLPYCLDKGSLTEPDACHLSYAGQLLRYAWLCSPVLQLWMCTTMLALSHGCWGIHIHIQFPSCLQRKYWDHLSCLQGLRFLSFSRLNNVSFYTYIQHIVFIPLLFSGHRLFLHLDYATINPGAQKHL